MSRILGVGNSPSARFRPGQTIRQLVPTRSRAVRQPKRSNRHSLSGFRGFQGDSTVALLLGRLRTGRSPRGRATGTSRCRLRYTPNTIHDRFRKQFRRQRTVPARRSIYPVPDRRPVSSAHSSTFLRNVALVERSTPPPYLDDPSPLEPTGPADTVRGNLGKNF